MAAATIANDANELDELVAGSDDAVAPPVTSLASSPVRWSCGRQSHAATTTSEELYVPPTEALIFLEVRPPVFAAIWWGMVAIHTFTAALLTAQARLYIYLTDPHMAYYVNLVEPDIGAKYTAVAAVFGVLSAFHWRTVLSLVATSIRQRKYAFFPADHYEMKPFVQPPPQVRPSAWWPRVKMRLATWRLALWGRRGVLGVESRYFFPYFYLREFIELTSQIWQAYRGSLLVSRAWINHLSVTIIVLNCLLTPAFQTYYKQRPEVRRLAMVSLDAVLDFLTAIVVPVSIFLPYFASFDPTTRSFPLEKTYDERWFVNGVLENQEFLIVSVADLIFKCIPHISITGCLKRVRLLVIKDSSVRVGQGNPVYATVVAPSARRDLARAKMERMTAKNQKATAQQPSSNKAMAVLMPQTKRLSKYTHKYASKLVRLAFVVVGLAVLGMHLKGIWTSHRANKAGCKQEMRPWFAPSFACSIFEVDCHRLNMTGTEDEVRQALTHLYAPAVAALVFSHCPALVVPSEIRGFTNLMRMDVYNSTIARWDERAALTNADHPSMATLMFARVNFPDGQLPPGLISWSFPDGLRSVEIARTNLKQLPDDLHERWHHSMTRLYIEHAKLTQIPTVLRYIGIEKLSLEGNEITALDSTWLTAYEQQYLTLALSCNTQLSELPAIIHPSTSIHALRVHRTNLSSVPAWISDRDHRATGLHRVFASHTPLCDAVSNNLAAAAVSAKLMDETLLSCLSDDVADDRSRSDCGLFPLHIVDLKRNARYAFSGNKSSSSS